MTLFKPNFWLSFFTFFGIVLAKRCQDLTIPIELSVRQGVFDVPQLRDNYDACVFQQNLTSISGGVNYTAKVLTGYATVNGSYNISAELCVPDNSTANVIQVLTHGIGFDKSYWHIPFDSSEYSYVDTAADHYGYATLSYDRLGIAQSTHADPVKVAQAPAQISALYQINLMLRNGSPHIPHPQCPTIVNVGHSFGAQQSYQLATMYPNITDGLILQGFSFNTSFFLKTISSINMKLARFNQPLRLGNSQASNRSGLLNSAIGLVTQAMGGNNKSDSSAIINTTGLLDLIAGYNDPPSTPGLNYANNYLTWSDANSFQYSFLYPPYFNRTLLSHFEATTKQPFAVGELLTLGPPPTVSPFTGPVQILTGNQDAIYCGGDCSATGVPGLASIPAAAKMYFPRARSFEAYVQPNTGHAVNLHENATGAYRVMQEFLGRNGLRP